MQSDSTGGRGVRWLARVAALVATLGAASAPAEGPEGETVLGATAIARPGSEWDADGSRSKLEFDFGDFKAWARKKGGWRIEGWIHHRGLACVTYHVAVRFGVGSPGCNDVKWLAEPQYVSQRLQCNNASVLHEGGDVEFAHAGRFAEVSCAERIVRCSGNCQLSFQGEPPGRAPAPPRPLGP